MATLREDITDLRERVDDSERTAKEYPHGAKYLQFVVDFFRGKRDSHEQLVEEVEREFATSARRQPRSERQGTRAVASPKQSSP